MESSCHVIVECSQWQLVESGRKTFESGKKFWFRSRQRHMSIVMSIKTTLQLHDSWTTTQWHSDTKRYNVSCVVLGCHNDSEVGMSSKKIYRFTTTTRQLQGSWQPNDKKAVTMCRAVVVIVSFCAATMRTITRWRPLWPSSNSGRTKNVMKISVESFHFIFSIKSSFLI